MEGKSRALISQFRYSCRVCGKPANKQGLCRDHGFSEGPIWVLDMRKWTWKREIRKIAGMEKA
jgi:hypothetical protein